MGIDKNLNTNISDRELVVWDTTKHYNCVPCCQEEVIEKCFLVKNRRAMSKLSREFGNAQIYHCAILFDKSKNKGIFQFRQHSTLENKDCFYFFNGRKISRINSSNLQNLRSKLVEEGFPEPAIEICLKRINEVFNYQKNLPSQSF